VSIVIDVMSIGTGITSICRNRNVDRNRNNVDLQEIEYPIFEKRNVDLQEFLKPSLPKIRLNK
jgi:hypothetical protein